MNFELCKKCFGEKIRAGYQCYDLSSTVMSIVCNEDVSDDEETRYCCKTAICNNNKLPAHKHWFEGLEDLSLTDETCPYFLEHRLYDWNKKTDQK